MVISVDIDVDYLTRSWRTTCCRVFMHKPSHQQMVAQVQTCSNCCCENAKFEGVVLENDEVMEEEMEDANLFNMAKGFISILNAVVV